MISVFWVLPAADVFGAAQQTLEGLLRREERRRIVRTHQNAQRLLKPLFVVNPHTADLAFPDSLTRMRRDHMKYLTLIRSIALLHQHQRPLKGQRGVSYIEAAREDIELATRLMNELMRRSLEICRRRRVGCFRSSARWLRAATATKRSYS